MHHSKMSDAPHVQLPAVLDMVYAVTGGGIGLADGHKAAWIIKSIEVEGKTFGNIYTKASRCKTFLGKKYTMVEHIKTLRNLKVYELMQACSKEDDPNAKNAPIDGNLTMPKRELADRLPKVITVDVPTASMMASVNLLPSWREKGVLQLEMTQPNLDLLLDDPPAESAPWKPELDHEDVFWIPSRNQVRCYWWDSGKSKTRIKSIGVELCPHMDESAKLAASRTAADELQRFYDAHNNRGDNNRGDNYDAHDTEGDPDTDDGSDASESSSNEEPPQKVARTDT
jgi:hypothetical protein